MTFVSPSCDHKTGQVAVGRLKGGSMVVLVIQRWHRGCSIIAMDARVAIKFWMCSKQPHKGRWGRNIGFIMVHGLDEGHIAPRWSFKWGWRDAGALPWLHNGCTMVGQLWPCNKCVLLQNSIPQSGRHFCLPCTSSVGPIACIEPWLWWPLCLHLTTLATPEQPSRWFCLLSASFMRFVVPPHLVFE